MCMNHVLKDRDLMYMMLKQPNLINIYKDDKIRLLEIIKDDVEFLSK